jgi:hypothetical protein
MLNDKKRPCRFTAEAVKACENRFRQWVIAAQDRTAEGGDGGNLC